MVRVWLADSGHDTSELFLRNEICETATTRFLFGYMIPRPRVQSQMVCDQISWQHQPEAASGF